MESEGEREGEGGSCVCESRGVFPCPAPDLLQVPTGPQDGAGLHSSCLLCQQTH